MHQGPYQQVNVDVIGVEIKGEGSESVTLNVIPGIYDLLKLSNGVAHCYGHQKYRKYRK
jgi:hypothetical protein